MASRPLAIAVLLPLLLAGCFSRSDVTSTITLNQGADDTVLMELRQQVEARALAFGGSCETFVAGLGCRFSPSGFLGSAEFEVEVVNGRELGESYVSIHSSITTFFPVPRSKLISADILPKQHRAWEIWMVENIPPEVTDKRRRVYSSTDIEQAF